MKVLKIDHAREKKVDLYSLKTKVNIHNSISLKYIASYFSNKMRYTVTYIDGNTFTYIC